MDENEELYRLMNGDDPWYMGDLVDPQQPGKKSELSNNSGCAGMFLFMVIVLIMLI
jgi:hypothetical protein